ncbi:MAG: hypothetical protein V1759_01050 [bacterium]
MPCGKEKKSTMRKCVNDVMAQGKSKDSAYAICTTSLEDMIELIKDDLVEYVTKKNVKKI